MALLEARGRQKWRDVLEAAASQRRQAEQIRLEYHTKAAKVLQRGIRSSIYIYYIYAFEAFLEDLLGQETSGQAGHGCGDGGGSSLVRKGCAFHAV